MYRRRFVVPVVSAVGGVGVRFMHGSGAVSAASAAATLIKTATKTTNVSTPSFMSDPAQRKSAAAGPDGRIVFHPKLPDQFITSILERHAQKLQIQTNTAQQQQQSPVKQKKPRPVKIDYRAEYWLETYTYLLDSRIVMVFQNNNMRSTEYAALKHALKVLTGAGIMVVRNAEFRQAVERVFGNHNNNENTDGNDMVSSPLMGLASLACGPTAVVFADASSTDRPRLVHEIVKILKSTGPSAGVPADAVSAASKLLFVGGKIDNVLVTASTISAVLALPSLRQSHGEIMGLLDMPGRSIVNTLSQTSASVAATLQQHQSQLEQS